MTDVSQGYSGEKQTSISPATERAAARRTAYNLTQTLSDFVEWLGTRSETLTFGGDNKSVPAGPLVDEYINARGLNTDPEQTPNFTPAPPVADTAPTPSSVSFDGSEPVSTTGGEATSSENVHLPSADSTPGPVDSQSSREPINESPGASEDPGVTPDASSQDAKTTIPEDAPPPEQNTPPVENASTQGSTSSGQEQSPPPEDDDRDIDLDGDGLDDEGEVDWFLSQHHATIATKVAAMNNVVRLNQLLDAETQRKNRPSVLQAIHDRLDQLNQGV